MDVTKKWYNREWNNEDEETIKNYWFFAGDYWLMDKKGNVYYKDCEYNFDSEKFDLKNIIDVNINFEKWLQFAYIDKEKDKILENVYIDDLDNANYEPYEEDALNRYTKKVQEISKKLYEIFID
jgi:hypothetical protein